jgi:hypothetical protein
MEKKINIKVIDPPTVTDTIFSDHKPAITFSHDTDRLTDEEFTCALPYLVDIEYYLMKISRLCWEGNIVVYIQSGCSNICCNASALTEGNKKIIEEEMGAIALVAGGLEVVLEDYVLIRMLKNIEKEIIHTLN